MNSRADRAQCRLRGHMWPEPPRGKLFGEPHEQTAADVEPQRIVCARCAVVRTLDACGRVTYAHEGRLLT